MATVINRNILVSIDSILDSRLGTLIKINTDFSFAISQNEEYYKRTEDLFSDKEFGVLSKEIYSSFYNKNKEDIIRNSPMTKLHVFLRELCGSLLNSAVNTPFLTGVTLDVNLYPYRFNDTEVDYIVKAVAMQLGGMINVKAVNISNKELSCKHIKENYSAMIMYDYSDWMSIHQKTIQTNVLKEIVLYAPRLNYVRSITEEESKIFTERSLDPFEVLGMILCEFISLQHLPINMFCADTPANK